MKFKLIISAIISTLLTFSTLSFAKSNKMYGSCSMNKLVKELNLSDEKAQEIQSMIKKHKTTMMKQFPKEKNMKKSFEKMQAIISADKFDEKKAKALIAKKQDKMENMMLEKMKMKQHIYTLLPNDKKEKYLELLSQKHEKRMKKMAKKKHKMQDLD